MSHPDYYELLGIKPTATLEQIKAGYRRQALRHHPDKNPDAEAADRFKICSEAYCVLSDPRRRAEYDEKSAVRGVQDLARDILTDLMGGRRRRKRDGKDLRFDLTISLRESAEGTHKQISFPVAVSCSACGGSGACPGGIASCPACDGRGDLREGAGILSLSKPCPRCGGQGVMVTSACKACGGVGSVERDRRYDVKLPPGVREGDVKILEREGEPGVHGGRSGDLHIVIHVEQHPLLEQDGVNLVIELPVRFTMAVLGDVVDVPTLTGTVRMKIPAGTQSGRVFRLRGKGLAGSGSSRGDQLVRIVVETPVNLDAGSQELLRAFDQSCGPQSHPRRSEIERQGDESKQ